MNIVAIKLVWRECLAGYERVTTGGSCEGDRSLSVFYYTQLGAVGAWGSVVVKALHY